MVIREKGVDAGAANQNGSLSPDGRKHEMKESDSHLPIDAASKDCEKGAHNSVSKHPEVLTLPHSQTLRLRAPTRHILPHPQPVINTHGTKERKHNNLKTNTSDDSVVPAVEQLLVVLARCGGDATAHGLDD